LQQVVLHDISDDTNVVKVATSTFGTEGFLEGDLHRGDVLVVPDPTEQFVTESQNQQVLDHFFTQVVVDSVDFVFGEQWGDLLLQFTVGGQVTAKRLFNDDSELTVLRVDELLDLLTDGVEDGRRQGQVEQSFWDLYVVLGFVFLSGGFQFLVTVVGVVWVTHIRAQVQEVLLGFFVAALKVGGDLGFEVLVGQVGSGVANDLDSWGQLLFSKQAKQGREGFFASQVTGSTENDDSDVVTE
jgi:hypothetical protein